MKFKTKPIYWATAATISGCIIYGFYKIPNPNNTLARKIIKGILITFFSLSCLRACIFFTIVSLIPEENLNSTIIFALNGYEDTPSSQYE